MENQNFLVEQSEARRKKVFNQLVILHSNDIKSLQDYAQSNITRIQKELKSHLKELKKTSEQYDLTSEERSSEIESVVGNIKKVKKYNCFAHEVVNLLKKQSEDRSKSHPVGNFSGNYKREASFYDKVSTILLSYYQHEAVIYDYCLYNLQENIHIQDNRIESAWFKKNWVNIQDFINNNQSRLIYFLLYHAIFENIVIIADKDGVVVNNNLLIAYSNSFDNFIERNKIYISIEFIDDIFYLLQLNESAKDMAHLKLIPMFIKKENPKRSTGDRTKIALEMRMEQKAEDLRNISIATSRTACNILLNNNTLTLHEAFGAFLEEFNKIDNTLIPYEKDFEVVMLGLEATGKIKSTKNSKDAITKAIKRREEMVARRTTQQPD